MSVTSPAADESKPVTVNSSSVSTVVSLSVHVAVTSRPARSRSSPTRYSVVVGNCVTSIDSTVAGSSETVTSNVVEIDVSAS